MLKQQVLLSVKKRKLSWGKGGQNNKFSTFTVRWVTDKIVLFFWEVHNKRMSDNGYKPQCEN